METPRQKPEELTLPNAEHNHETPIAIKKSQIKVSKSHARNLSSDDENDNNPNPIATKQKPQPQTQPAETQNKADLNQVNNNKPNPQLQTQVTAPAKEKIGIPVEPKEKDQYRVGQVIDENNTQAKPKTKPPVSDTEPQKIAQPAKTQKIEKVPQLDATQLKERPRLEESGFNSARSDRDPKANFPAVKTKKLDNGQLPLDSGARGTFEAYEKLMEAKGVPKNAAEIDAENKQLRQFLKDLNEQLQQHLEKVKVENFEGKKVEFKNKSAEEQIRTIIRELANNEKILAYNKEEYRKTEARLNAIKDPKYVMKIQQEIMKIQINIDEIKKENKRTELKNGTVGKDLDVIENVKGMPVSVEETHLREKEAVKFELKLQQLKQKNKELEAERKQKLEKQQAVAEQIKKLERQYFGDSYVSEQDTQKYNKLQKNLDVAEEDLKMAKNKCKFRFAQISRDMEELLMQNHKEREHVERLEDVVQDQSKALKELLATGGARMSKGSQEVLDQIRYTLENEEKRRMASPTGAEETRLRDKERSAILLKNKSVSGMKMETLQHELQSATPGSSKHKNTIKRELEGKKSTYKETGPLGRPKLEELGNVKKGVRGEEDESDVMGKKKPSVEKSEKKGKAVKEEEVEEEVKDVKSHQKGKKEGNESPREVKSKNSQDKEVRKEKEEHRENENELKKEKEKEREREKEREKEKEKEKKQNEKNIFDSDDDTERLKQEMKQYSKKIEQEVVHENKDTVKKSQLKITKLHAHKLADDDEDDTGSKTLKKKEGGLENEHSNTVTPRQAKKNDAPKKKEDDIEDVDELNTSTQNVLAANSKREGESKRKDTKDTDSTRPQQQQAESPQKSQRGTHNDEAEAREWDESNDFGKDHRMKLNKPKGHNERRKDNGGQEALKETKKGEAPEFEEIEFDA